MHVHTPSLGLLRLSQVVHVLLLPNPEPFLILGLCFGLGRNNSAAVRWLVEYLIHTICEATLLLGGVYVAPDIAICSPRARRILGLVKDVPSDESACCLGFCMALGRVCVVQDSNLTVLLHVGLSRDWSARRRDRSRARPALDQKALYQTFCRFEIADLLFTREVEMDSIVNRSDGMMLV